MNNLKKMRHMRNMAQSKLAKEAKVSLRMIQHYEQGVKNINNAKVTTVVRLAKALNCNVEDILEGSE